MNLGLSGKVALILGGSRGLGRGVAREFGAEGCKVVIAARSQPGIDKTVAEIRSAGGEATGFAVDITRKDDIHRLFQAAQQAGWPPDILVFNTAELPRSRFDKATDEEYLNAYRMCVMAFAWCVQEAQSHMARNGWGRIVSFNSISAKESDPTLGLVLHNVARLAGLGLSKTLADELGRYGVTVNAVAIGSFEGHADEPDSGAQRRYRAAAAQHGRSYEEEVAHRVAKVPVRRLARPDELGALCTFLASDRAGFITGQTIVIDGGRTRTYI